VELRKAGGLESKWREDLKILSSIFVGIAVSSYGVQKSEPSPPPSTSKEPAFQSIHSKLAFSLQKPGTTKSQDGEMF
jgi:hypothetical protein